MKYLWLVLLTLVIELAWPAGARSSPPEADGDSDCTLADAEIDFVRGLGAFNNEDLEKAESYFTETIRCNPEHGSALYWLGAIHLLQDKPHDAVAEISRSLKAKEPPRADRWRVLVHLGAALLEIQNSIAACNRLVAARRIFRRIQIRSQEEDWNKSDVEALHLLGRSLKRVNRTKKGEEVIALARSLDRRIEDSEAAVALPRYRGPFWPPEGPWSWDGRLGLSAGADSNPNLLDGELALTSLEGELVQGTESDDVQNLDVRLALYRLSGEERQTTASNGWSLGLTFHGRQSIHRKFDFLDLGQSRAVVHLAWGKDPLSYMTGPLGYTWVPYGASRFSVLLQAGYLYTQLDGRTYFQGAGSALSVTVRETRLTDTRIELTYQDLDFDEDPFENRARSGSVRAIDVSQFLYLKRRNRYLRLGLVAGERDADLAYSRSFVEARTEAALPLRSKWSFLLTGSIRRENFDRPESNLFQPAAGTELRKDTTVRATATLVWSIRPRLRFFALLSYVDRDSNLQLSPDISGLDYERTRGSLGFRWFLGSGGEAR